MLNLRTPVVFFDLETGGLLHNQPIIQIGAIAVDTNWHELETFEKKLIFKPEECDAIALEKNHYTPEAWIAAIEPYVAFKEFGQMLDRHRSVEMISKSGKPYKVARIGGHNIVGFDIERIKKRFKEQGLFFPVELRTALDTWYGAVWYFERTGESPEDYKLSGGLAKHFGIDTTNAHDALADVRISIELAKKIL